MMKRIFVCGMLWLICLFYHTSLVAQVYNADGKKLSVKECLIASEERKNLGDYRGASDFLNKAALIHWERKELRVAINYFQESLKLNEKVDNQSGMYGIYSNLATIYADLEVYDSALTFFERTLEGRKKQGAREPIISAHINTAVVLNNLKRHQEAATHLLDALSLAQEKMDLEQMRSCYGMLAETYETAGDREQTKHYFELYRSLHEMTQKKKIEKVVNEAEQAKLRAELSEVAKEKAELEIALKNVRIKEQEEKIESKNDAITELEENYSKQELAYKVLRQESEIKEANYEKEQAQNEQRIARQRLWITAIGSVLLLALVGTFFIYKSQQEKKKANLVLLEKNEEISTQQERIIQQNNKLENALAQIGHKNKQITASINYAKRIQEAILPDTDYIKKYLPESFVYFRPRDIVSGDFYFFHQRGNLVFLSAIDCTGHGVPGALMSMIGNEVLTHLIIEKKISSPAQILTQLSEGVRSALHKGQTHIRDGMDMALVCIDQNNKTIIFAGAKNPIVYFQDKTLHIIKGDRMPIGGTDREAQSDFTEHKVMVDSPTTFYLFSDGFQDQFGGKEGKKFMSKKFRSLLSDIHHKDLTKQKEELSQTFENWIGDTYEPVDDVLVIGARIS